MLIAIRSETPEGQGRLVIGDDATGETLVYALEPGQWQHLRGLWRKWGVPFNEHTIGDVARLMERDGYKLLVPPEQVLMALVLRGVGTMVRELHGH